MNIGLCAFSFTGAAREAGLKPDPTDPYDLMQMASDSGFTSVEFAPQQLPSLEDKELSRCREKLEELGLRVTIAGSRIQAEGLGESIEIAEKLGAKTVRTVLSGLLEGDRRTPPGPDWSNYLTGLISELKEVRSKAEDFNISIALENHQDATSADLVRICQEVDSTNIGVNLDAGNALAVVEDPMEYARNVAPWLKNVHLKDYIVYLTESGYRLVRCAFGDGVLPFAELFELFDSEAPEATRNIENGATTGRHIRMAEDFFWDYYPETPLKKILPALRIALQQARPDSEEWRTPHELEESAEVRAEYEMEQFRKSVENARDLFPDG